MYHGNINEKYTGIYDIEGKKLGEWNKSISDRGIWLKYKELRGKEGFLVTYEYSNKFRKIEIEVIRFSLYLHKTNWEYIEDLAHIGICRHNNTFGVYAYPFEQDTYLITNTLMKMGKMIPLITEMIETIKNTFKDKTKIIYSNSDLDI